MPDKKATPYTVLQMRLKLRVKPDVFLAHSAEPAAAIAKVKGLLWKIWVFQEEEQEVGGVYLFDSREAAESYLNHPVIEAMRNHPAIVSTHSQLWDVENSLSAITRAPLSAPDVEQSKPVTLFAGGQ